MRVLAMQCHQNKIHKPFAGYGVFMPEVSATRVLTCFNFSMLLTTDYKLFQGVFICCVFLFD